MNLINFKMNTLVSMVNALGGNAGAKTFSQRSKAIARLMKLAAEKKVELNEVFDADGNKIVVAAKAPKKVSIRSVAEALLVQADAGTGLSYEAVLAAVKAQFPAAKTTVGCLRWYVAHMREAGVSIPNRPRATVAK
jgi:hypothetical protein